MHMPDRSRRWAERLLARLAHRGMTEYVRPGRGGQHLHYLTPTGIRAAEQIPTRVEMRRKLITPEQATGPLWRHTLAVNDTGIAFMQAARSRGDECGPFSWRHEIAHHIPAPGRRAGEQVISDLLLTYLAEQDNGQITFHYRLIELDRATVPVDALTGKLARYTDLYRHLHSEKPGQPVSRALYPVFPDVHCILTGRPRSVLQRRAQTVLALLNNDPRLKTTPQVRVSLALLEDLQQQGPWAAIWRMPRDPARTVDWLGRDTGGNYEPGRAGHRADRRARRAAARRTSAGSLDLERREAVREPGAPPARAVWAGRCGDARACSGRRSQLGLPARPPARRCSPRGAAGAAAIRPRRRARPSGTGRRSAAQDGGRLRRSPWRSPARWAQARGLYRRSATA